MVVRQRVCVRINGGEPPKLGRAGVPPLGCARPLQTRPPPVTIPDLSVERYECMEIRWKKWLLATTLACHKPKLQGQVKNTS